VKRRHRCLTVAGLAVIVAWYGGGAWANGSTEDSLLQDLSRRMQVGPAPSYYILRLDLDVTGDGQRELLLAVASRHAQLWQVYGWAGEKQVRHIGRVPFAYGAFLLTTDPTSLVGTYYLDADRIGFATYQIDASGVQRLSLRDAMDPGVPKYDFAAWRKKVGLKVPGADLEDLRASPTPEWRDHLTGEPVAGLGGLLDVTVVQ
jgi:hypothetical protein